MQSAIACAQFTDGRFGEAFDMAEAAMGERPNIMLPICIAVTSAAHAGRLDKAQGLLNQLRQLAPGISISYLGEVFSYLRADDLEQWIEGFRMAGLPEYPSIP